MKILRALIICILTSASFFSYAHDFKVAYFDIYKEAGTNYIPQGELRQRRHYGNSEKGICSFE